MYAVQLFFCKGRKRNQFRQIYDFHRRPLKRRSCACVVYHTQGTTKPNGPSQSIKKFLGCAKTSAVESLAISQAFNLKSKLNNSNSSKVISKSFEYVQIISKSHFASLSKIPIFVKSCSFNHGA